MNATLAKWSRRVVVIAAAAIVLVLIGRLIVAMLLAPVIERVAGIYDLDCHYERMSLNLLSGSAEIWNVQLTPRGGGEPILHADYCQGDVSAMNLLRGRLVIYRVAADGVELNVQRTKDGRVPLLERIVAAVPAGTSGPSASPGIDFQAPLRVDALRLDHVSTRFVDQFVTPNLEAHFLMDLRLSDLGTGDRPTRFEMDFSSDPMLESLQITGQSESTGQTLSADMNVRLRGLHLKPAAQYLAVIGLQPTADDLSGSMSAFMRLAAPRSADQGFQAIVSVDHADLTADGQSGAAVDHLSVDAQSITATGARLGVVLINGARLSARRNSSGNLSALGVEYSPSPQAARPTVAALPDYRLSLQHFILNDFQAQFADDAAIQPVALDLRVRRLSADNAADSQSPIRFAAEMAAPGMARQIQVAGQLKPFAADKSFDLTASAEGAVFSAIQPYLTPWGLATEWHDGSAKLVVDGKLIREKDGELTASARVSDFHLTDSQNLLTLNDAQIGSVHFDPRTETISAGSIDVSGPNLSVRRDAAGDFHALGFRFHPSAAVLGQLSQGTGGSAALLPNVRIGHFSWKNIALAFDDAAVSPPAELTISDAGLTAENVVIPPPPGGSKTVQGAIHAWLAAPNIAPAIAVDGTITSSPRKIAVDADIRGDGLRGNAVAAYLNLLGAQPTLQNASLRLHGGFAIDTSGDNPTFTVSVRNGRLTDGGDELAAVNDLSADSLRVQTGAISLQSVKIASPRVQVIHDADGAFEVAGLRVRPASENLNQFGPVPAISLDSFQMTDAGLHWIDRAVQPNVDTVAHLSATANHFRFGQSEQPATFDAVADVQNSLDSLSANGTLRADDKSAAIELKVSGSGLRAGSLAAYLPPSAEPTLRDGRFHADVALAVSANPRGGARAELTVSDLDLRDGDQSKPLLDFTTLHVKASRIDPAAMLIALDDLTLQGCDARVHAGAAGLELPGLELNSNAIDAPAPPEVAPSGNILEQVAAERARLPLITLENLDLNCRGVAVSYDSPDHPAALVLSDLHVHNTNPLTWLGRDVESNPSTDLELTGRLDGEGASPVADSFKAEVHALPFLRQKTLNVDLLVNGIHGPGLAAVAPGLLNGVDCANLKNGQLSVSLSAALSLQNVRQTDINFAYGGKLDFGVKDFEFRAEPNGPVLLGAQEIQSEGIAIGPDFSSVKIPELRIENIAGAAEREQDGIHFMNLTIPIGTITSHAPSVAAADPPPARTVSMDRLLISGMKFQIEDRTVSPPLEVPIDGLDVEAQGLSNVMFTDGKPVRYSVLVNAGSTNSTSPPVFAQVASSGVLTLAPSLKGWAKASVSGLELSALSGVARAHDVNLSGGTFDDDTDLRFPGDGSMDTSSRVVLTDLSISDSPNGNLSHALSLPAPLGVVIGALQDQDGSITLPLNVAVREGALDAGSVAAAGSTAFLAVVATAIASTPLKVGSLLGGDSQHHLAEPPMILSFPAGYPALSPDQIARLTPLIRRLQRDKTLEVTIRHELGKGDIAVAAERVNPTRDDAMDLADSFNLRRDALLAAQRTATSDVRALLASSAADEAERAMDRLRTIDQQLADADNALDHIYDLLRPGADRQAIRRTRAAGLAIAADRLQAVRDLLVGSGKLKIEPDRIHLTNAQFTAVPATAQGRLTITVIQTK